MTAGAKASTSVGSSLCSGGHTHHLEIVRAGLAPVFGAVTSRILPTHGYLHERWRKGNITKSEDYLLQRLYTYIPPRNHSKRIRQQLKPVVWRITDELPTSHHNN